MKARREPLNNPAGEGNRSAAVETAADLFDGEFQLPRVAATAPLVNRTHRVVRERARTLQERKRKTRSLWIPVGVSAGLTLVLVVAFWTLLDQYEAAPTGLPDASQQIFILLLWCLPLTAGLLAAVWVRRTSQSNARETGGENA